jgi:hypothetical protein
MNETLATPEETATCERVSRMEVNRRVNSGEYDSRDRRDVDGKSGRLILVRSLSFDGQQRFRQMQLEAAASPKPKPNPGQPSLFPRTQIDDQVEALRLPASQRDVILRRFRIVQVLLNSNWKALGYRSKKEYKRVLARESNISVRSVERLVQTWKKSGELNDLAKDRPGPLPGTGRALDADMRAHLYDCYVIKKLTASQCCRSLINYLQQKQNSPGCRVSHSYHPPSRSSVERFLHSLDAIDQAARKGPDALRAACGHIDRSYLDLASLECVESDEWKVDLFSFDPLHRLDQHKRLLIRRYWLLTFYDVRSMYPLVWKLCEGLEHEPRHGITVEDEIDLFVALIRNFGVPAAIHSDRGRFRGKDWGGEPYQQHIDKEFAAADGILQRVGELAGLPEGIRHDMPRVHNPRGTRLERFHRWLADCCRGKPGWTGTMKEREAGLVPRGDADRQRHKLWCFGKLGPGERSPLMTKDEISAEVNKMMEAWREHNSEGTDMGGLTPRAIFVQCSPASGFRRISEERLALATAQHFLNEHIATGGIIVLRDGSRYSHPLLVRLAGQKREVVRLRHDHSFITVLPAQKGEEAVKAPRRTPVGMNDPDELARQMELENRVLNVAGPMVMPLEYDPGREFPDAATESVNAAPEVEFSHSVAQEQGPPPLDPIREVGSVEFMMEKDRYKRHIKQPMDFKDLEP